MDCKQLKDEDAVALCEARARVSASLRVASNKVRKEVEKLELMTKVLPELEAKVLQRQAALARLDAADIHQQFNESLDAATNTLKTNQDAVATALVQIMRETKRRQSSQ